MLAILIGLLTILTWHFTKIYTTKSLNSLAYDLRYELLQRPILRMWNILNSTAEITTAQVKLSEYVIRSHNKLATQEDHVEVNCYLFSSFHCTLAKLLCYMLEFRYNFHLMVYLFVLFQFLSDV
jgi:hypothetical protein